MLGDCLLMSLCRGQALIALSSGEAEYYGLVTGISEGLGIVSLARDFGVHLDLQVKMDATAGISIGSRRGLGRVKHLDTIFLWIKEVIAEKRASLRKIHGQLNPLDILTKPVNGQELQYFCEKIGFEFLDGKSSLAFDVLTVRQYSFRPLLDKMFVHNFHIH